MSDARSFSSRGKVFPRRKAQAVNNKRTKKRVETIWASSHPERRQRQRQENVFKDTDEWRCDKRDRVFLRHSRGLRGEIMTPKFCLKSRLTVSCSADAAPTASVLLPALRRPLRDLADVIICRSRRAGAFKNITASISHSRRHESTKPASFCPRDSASSWQRRLSTRPPVCLLLPVRPL